MKRNNNMSQYDLKKALHYNPVTGVFTWSAPLKKSNKKPGDTAGYIGRHGYVLIKHGQTRYPAHRLAWLYMTGGWPLVDIDHINRVKHDNRYANLRAVSRRVNKQNLSPPKNNTSGAIGVRFEPCRQLWLSRIKHKGKTYNLGRYSTFQLALEARKKAEKKFFEPIA